MDFNANVDLGVIKLYRSGFVYYCRCPLVCHAACTVKASL